jgi:UDP-2,3-diacylglucosamine pyrophosphatase LpxH
MPGFDCRTAFISDIHLGTRECRAAYLLDFLERLDCERLVLVGDVFDLWACAAGSSGTPPRPGSSSAFSP